MFLIGLPLSSVALASSEISNTQSIMFWSFNLVSIILNTCALLFNAFVMFKNITEKPGDATGDFTALLCFPLTICLTPIFVISLACLLSSGDKTLILH